jgi:hypothetical protein
MDILELDRRASDALGKVVVAVTPEDLRRPTPCADWSADLYRSRACP